MKFDLFNFEKYGFDAKSSTNGHYLEIKQCSYSSETWGGTWNDTNEEKAVAFSDSRLFTVVALWKGASDLQFMVYGQNKALGEHLHRLVVNRKAGNRSTQTISMKKLIIDFGFVIIAPPDKTKVYVNSLIAQKYSRKIKLSNTDVRTIHDI